jgi:predicted nucleotidyltransferase
VIYTIKELTDRITPVAIKHGLPAVYLFGSYARGEARDDSDVDILVDKTGTNVWGLFAVGALIIDLEGTVEKSIDLVDTGALEQATTEEWTPWFVENVNREKIKIYG